MNDFLKEDRNLVPRYGSNINLDIYQDIDNSLNIVESNNNLKSDRYHDKLLKKYNTEKFNNLGKLINYKDALMLTYLIGVDCVIRELSHTSTILKIGNTILTNIFLSERSIYKKENDFKTSEILEDNRYFSYENFLSSYNISNNDIFFIGDHFLNLFLGYPVFIFEKTFDAKKGFLLGESTGIKFTGKYLDQISKTVIINPHSIPMLCLPNKWSDDSFGGYLNNSLLKNPLINKSADGKHETLNKNVLYESINIMSSIPFEINNLLLNFISEGKGDFLFSKEDKDDKKSYEVTLSQAYILKDKKFYIPLRADFRGRIYTDSYYLNYQGDDFSSAIIQFAEGEPLTERGLRNLYIYIANVYNFEGISKKNFHERIKWVEENKKKNIQFGSRFYN